MLKVGLTFDEFQRVVSCCCWIVISRCPPGFDLKRFLVERLKGRHPGTAAKVKGMDEEEICRLCLEIREHQRLAR
jgi:hypothetical protein